MDGVIAGSAHDCRLEVAASSCRCATLVQGCTWFWVHRDGSWRVGAYRVEQFGYGRDEVPREAGYVLCLTLDEFLEGGAPCSPDMIDSLREIGSNQSVDLVDDQLVEALCVEWQKSEEG